jgi:long-chain acyl-CoA synthetase
VAAMLALDEDELDAWADEKGLTGVGLPDLLSHDILRAELQAAVDEANRSVSKAESIRTFVVLPRDLSIDSGELTPTLKVRRMVVAKTYGSVIEEMYG